MKNFKLLLSLVMIIFVMTAICSCAIWEHWHSMRDGWVSDETHHWHDCVSPGCHEKLESAEHSFGEPVVKVPATCSGEGELGFVCTVCGYEKTEAIATLPHPDENTDHKCDVCEAPVGTHEAAEGTHNCGYCGQTMSECSAEEDDGDCTTAIKCSVCGKEMIPGKASHDANEDDGNCTTAVTCKVCGKVVVEAKPTHESNNGSHTCKVCGITLSGCEDGDKDHNCDLCGTKLSDCADENKDHNCDICGTKLSDCADHYDAGQVTTPATCVDDGVKTYTCQICGGTKTETISATGVHKDDNKNYICDVCNADLTTKTRFEAEGSQVHNGEIKIEYTDRASNGTLVGYFREGIVMVFTIVSDEAEENVAITICGATAKEKDGALVEITAEEITSMFACNGVALKNATGSFAGSSDFDLYNFTQVVGYVDLKEGVNYITFTNLGPAMNMDYIELTTKEANVSWTYSENAPTAECTDADKNHICDVCLKTSSTCDQFYDEGTVTKQPSCTETGLKVYNCTLCGQSHEEVLPVVHVCDTLDVSGALTYDATTGAITNNGLIVSMVCTKCGQGDAVEGFTVDTSKMFTDGLVVSYSEATAVIPAFNPQNYTVSSAKTGGNDPRPVVTTTFDSEKIDCTVVSNNFFVANGKVYSRYELSLLQSENVNVYYDGTNYVYDALNPVTLTKEIRTYGTMLVITGEVNFDLTDRWTHNNGFIVGSSEKTGSVTVNVNGSNGIFLWDGANIIVNEGSSLDVKGTDAYAIWAGSRGSHITVDGTLVSRGHIFLAPEVSWTHPDGDRYNSNPNLYARKGNIEVHGDVLVNFVQVGSVKNDYTGKLTVKNGSIGCYVNTGDVSNKDHQIRWIFSKGELNFENNGGAIANAMKTDQNGKDRVVLFDAGIKVNVTGAYTTFLRHGWSGMSCIGIHTDATFNLPENVKMYNHENNYSSYSYNTFTTATVMIDGEMKKVHVTNTPDAYVVNTVVEYSQSDILKVDNADGTAGVGAIEITGEFTTVEGRTRVGDWFFSQATDANGNVIYYQVI